MKRIAFVLLWGLLIGGCNKPSEESCRKALSNMRTLIGTDDASSSADTDGDIRRCRGGSSKKAVECAANAKTLEELRACEFMKLPDKQPSSGSGSAAGSDPTGSAATGSAAGSDATGSAATGSAAEGSGSAAPAPGSGSAR